MTEPTNVRKPVVAAALALVLLIGGCADGPTLPGPPAGVVVEAGGDQSAPAGTALPSPIVVRVTDLIGRGVLGVEARFVVVSGNGQVSSPTALTDADGRASSTWTLGPVSADSQRLEVRIVDPASGAVQVATTVRATAVPGQAATLVRVGEELRSGPTGSTLDSLRVRIVDTHGNGVPGVAVAWSAQPEGGTLSSTTSTTRSDGTTAVAWILGTTAGSFTATATAAGLEPVVFQAEAAHTTFDIRVQLPGSGAFVGRDTLRVVASATSSVASISRMTARVDGQGIDLVGGEGWLPLEGVSEGSKTLVVTAYTAAGDSGSVAVPFRYNSPPTLAFSSVQAGTVIRDATVRVEASCTDQTPCTVSVYLSTAEPSIPPTSGAVAQGTGSITADVPVSEFDGRSFFLTVVARDSGNLTQWTTIRLHAESTPRWNHVFTADAVLDVDATRVLYVTRDASGARRSEIAPRSGGSPTIVASRGASAGRLFPGGAIFRIADSIYEYRGGTTTPLAFSNTGQLNVAGAWAIWHTGNTLIRRNLESGTNTVVSTSAVNNGGVVGPNGNVAYQQGGGITFWKDGVHERIAENATDPRTDGAQVAFFQAREFYDLYRDGSVVRLTRPGIPAPGYDVQDGWAAYIQPDAGSTVHVWTMAPDGTRRQVSAGGNAAILALGPGGRIVFSRGGRAYLAQPPYTTAPIDVGGAFMGTYRFIGTDLYVFLGRSAFRVEP